MMSQPPHQRFRRTARVLVFVCLVGGVAGCGVLPYFVTQIFGGNEKVKPQYEFPKDKKILVFVESAPALGYLSGTELVRTDLANVISKQLVENKVAAGTISQARLQNVLEQLPPLASKSEVGQKCDADFVLYVKIEKLSFQDVPNTTLYTGRIRTSVKVIEVGKGQTFPPVEKDHPLKEITLVPADDSSPTYTNYVARELVVRMGDAIAKLFYEHEVPKNGDPMSME